MASRKAVGAAFFQELIDTTPKNDIQRITIRSLQLDYARMRYDDSIPTYDSAGAACRDAVHYATKALDNGKECAARMLTDLARWGHCLPKNTEFPKHYHQQSSRCPRE